MKGKREKKRAVGTDRSRSGGMAWLAYGVAALFLCTAAAILYAWVETGRQKPMLRPVATAEALLGTLPRSASQASQDGSTPSSDGEEGVSAPERTEAAAESKASPELPKAEARENPPPKAAGGSKPPPKVEPLRDRALAVGLFRSQSNRIDTERMLEGLALPYYHKKKWRVDQTLLLMVKEAGGGKVDAAAEALAAAGYDFERTRNGLAAYFFDDEEARDALAVVAKAGAKGSVAKKKERAPRWAVYCGPLTEEEAESASKRLAGKGVKALRAPYEP